MAFIPGLSVPGTEGLDTSLKESKCKCRSSQVFKGLSPELLIKCHFDHNLAIEASHKYKNKENRLYPLMERYINRDSRNCWQQISYRKPQRNFPQDSIWGLIFLQPSQKTSTLTNSSLPLFLLHPDSPSPPPELYPAFWINSISPRSQKVSARSLWHGTTLWQQSFSPFPSSAVYDTPFQVWTDYSTSVATNSLFLIDSFRQKNNSFKFIT